MSDLSGLRVAADLATAEAEVRRSAVLVARHEETIGKLADVAKAARDEAEWMRAEALRVADGYERAGFQDVPDQFRRIAAGPPEDGTT